MEKCLILPWNIVTINSISTKESTAHNSHIQWYKRFHNMENLLLSLGWVVMYLLLTLYM